jgi:GNAT superfamily N-acetyltransferase
MTALRLRLRTAGPNDAEAVALLHADSWRRHYRGAYSDSYLDGDVMTDRRAVWSARLAAPVGTETILAEYDYGDEAEDDGEDGAGAESGAGANAGLIGFVHTVFDADERWGSLVDNLHVRHDRKRTGAGRALMIRAAAGVVEHAMTKAMYLWVLEQNTAAQQFYQALSGACVEKAQVPAPGGNPANLNGLPNCLRMAWPDASLLANGGLRT